MRIGEEMIDPNAGLEENPQENVEGVDDVSNLVEGFEISTNPEELAKNYEVMFEGIETAELEIYKGVIENAPAEVMAALEDGDTGPLVEHAKKSGIFGKKVVSFVAFALVTFFAANAFGAGGKMIEKVSMGHGSAQAKIERAAIGGGGDNGDGTKMLKSLGGGGIKIVESDSLKKQADFEAKVSEYLKTTGDSAGGDGSNENFVNGTFVDGKRM